MNAKTLSKRQGECVKLFADGQGHKSIAAMLNIEIPTVGTHLRESKKKLGLRNSAQLIKWAFAKGLSPL